MKTYLVTYELTYDMPVINDSIATIIQRYGAWAKISKNVWLVKTNSNRNDIINAIRGTLGVFQSILVIEVTSDWVTFNFSDEVVNWMRQSILP